MGAHYRLNVFLFFTMIASCGDENRRQEVVDDIRILGVKADQSLFTTGSVGPSNLEIYALAPPGKTPVFSAATDAEAIPSRNQVALVLSGSPTQTPLGDFVLYQQNASASLPASPLGLVPANTNGDIVFRYAFNVAGGSSNLLGIGDLFWLADASDPALALAASTITIDSPKNAVEVRVGEDVNLSANVSGASAEGVRISWFVAGGEVVNFRAAETTWKPDEADRGKSVPVLVAVRGLTTRSLDLKWVVVDVR